MSFFDLNGPRLTSLVPTVGNRKSRVAPGRHRRGLARIYALNSRAMALFTSILAFAGSATNALATAAAPNARRDFSTSGSGALDGLRAAAEATKTNKQRIDAA